MALSLRESPSGRRGFRQFRGLYLTLPDPIPAGGFALFNDEEHFPEARVGDIVLVTNNSVGMGGSASFRGEVIGTAKVQIVIGNFGPGALANPVGGWDLTVGVFF